jgi:hypothetical protein
MVNAVPTGTSTGLPADAFDPYDLLAAPVVAVSPLAAGSSPVCVWSVDLLQPVNASAITNAKN